MRILLINPNTSQATTEQMTAIAKAAAPPEVQISGATAQHGPPMILHTDELIAAAPQVVAIGRAARGIDGIVVAGFGDPGPAELRVALGVPSVGIAEAAMLEAARGGRRFGVATTTPALIGLIENRTRELGVGALYTGIRLTEGDPMALVADPPHLVEALAAAVRQCIERDGAEAVVIGGGPLGMAAAALTPRFATPVIAPIPAAVSRLVRLLKSSRGDPVNPE